MANNLSEADRLKPGILNGRGSSGSQSSSSIGSKSKGKIQARTGQEAPATQELVDVISNRQTRPGVQNPGERTRKVPYEDPAKDAGDADHTKITHGDGKYISSAKQTWKGANAGYTVVSEPKYTSAPAEDTYQDTRPHEVGSRPTDTGKYTGRSLDTAKVSKEGVGPEQKVKDHTVNEHKHGGEAKQVAGTTRDQSR